MTRTMRLSIKNSLGQWHGRPVDFSDMDLENFYDMLGKLSKGLYMKVETEDGIAFFPNEILKQSVIELQEVK